jgi:hypothetical protein
MFMLVKSLREELERFRARCFWWVAADAALPNLPRQTLIRGLQLHGGKAGMRLAEQLQRSFSSSGTSS